MTVAFGERHGSSLFDRYRRFKGERLVTYLFQWWNKWGKLKEGNQWQKACVWWLRRRLRDWFIWAKAAGLVRITVYERKESGVEAVWGYVLWDRGGDR
jgi:hypothetical protein